MWGMLVALLKDTNTYSRCCMHPRDVKHSYSFSCRMGLLWIYSFGSALRTHTLQLPRSLVQMSSLKHPQHPQRQSKVTEIDFINMSRNFQEFDTILERWGTCCGDRSCPTLNAPVLNVKCKAMRKQVRGVWSRGVALLHHTMRTWCLEGCTNTWTLGCR